MLTIEELRQKENEYKKRLEQVEGFLKISEKESELAELEAKMNAADCLSVSTLLLRIYSR